MSLRTRLMASRQQEHPGFPIRHARWLSLPFLAALLAFVACSAAAPSETPAAAQVDSTPPPTAQHTVSSPSTQPEEEPSPLVVGCNSPAAFTPATTEGPYFTPGSPERQSLLEDAMAGTHLTLTGYVLMPDCRPVPHALLDFWQADGNGIYDNNGYRMRGHQFTDETGRYRLETVIPGRYPGRTPHIHVKAQAPGDPVLTSQLYFPDEPGNDTDSIFSPLLLVTVQRSNGGIEATFDFVLGGQ